MRTAEDTTVVVVNDDTTILELIRQVLEDERYRVAVSGDADGGYRLIRAAPPHLAILDVHMAGAPDWHTVDRVKADPVTASVPVLVCSASAREMREAESRMRALGCDLLHMPFDIDELLERVRRLTVSAGRVAGR